jgi:glycosyltransferase involved in cell wall biosynthesis
MTATADVDVVVPVRDGGRLLHEAVASVLAQEGPRVRVLVVDDGSRDGAPDRLPADSRIVKLRNGGSGIPAALDTGLNASSAPLVARQDADDVSLPGRLARQVDFLNRHDGIGLVACGFEVVAGSRTVTTMRPSPVGMLERNPICAGTAVVRRSVLREAGGHREAFRLASDYDAWLRCAWVAGVAILPFVGYRYRLTAGMVTVHHATLQAAYAELARASARARIAGSGDPVDDAEGFIGSHLDPDPGGDAEVAAWWAREFAGLGARRDAVRCALRAARGLSRRRALRLLATSSLGRPETQAVWR